jgi:hypothetical protein
MDARDLMGHKGIVHVGQHKLYIPTLPKAVMVYSRHSIIRLPLTSAYSTEL